MAGSAVSGYLTAAAAVAAAIAARLALDPLMAERAPFITLFPAVVFAAWRGGRGPGLFAIAAGVVGAAYFLLEPRGTLDVIQPGYFAGLFVFVGVGLMNVWMVGALRTARDAAFEDRGRLRATLLGIGDGVIVTDTAGRVTELNAVAESLTGWTSAGAAGRPLDEVFAIVNEDTRAPVENPALRSLREGRVVGLANHTVLLRRGGGESPIEDSAAPVRGADGRVVGTVLVFRDVTAERAADRALRESEGRFRQAADSAPVLIWMAGTDGLCHYFNRSWLEFTGRTEDQERGDGWAEGVHPEDRDRCLAIYREALAARRAFRMDYRLRRRDGEYRWIDDQGVPRLDPGGRFLGYIGSCDDITDRKRTEEAARATEHSLRQVIDSIPGLVFTNTPDGMCDFVSEQWVDFTGIPAERQLGEGWTAVVHPDDRERAFAAWRAAVEGRGAYDLEYRVRRRDGAFEWFKVQGRPIRDREGRIVRWFGTALNIDGLKRAEDAVRESEERHRFLVEATSEAVWRFDLDPPHDPSARGPGAETEEGLIDRMFRDARLVECNEGMARAYGYPDAASMRGLPLSAFMPADRPANRGFLTAFARGGFRLLDAESEEVGADGRPMWFLNNLVGVRRGGLMVGAWGTSRDVTDRKRAETALRESEERYRLVARATNDVIWDWDLTTDELRWNDSLESVFGHRPADVPAVVGWWGDHIHPEDRDRVLRGVHAVIDGGGESWSGEYRFRRADGTYATVLDRGHVRRVDGRPVRMIGSMLDLTERLAAEGALRESERRTRQMLESLPQLVWTCTPDGSCDYLSPQWVQYTGIPEGEQLGDRWTAPMHPEDRERATAAWRAAVGGATGYDVDYRIRGADGRYRWFRARGRPLRDAAGRVVRWFGTSTDVHEQTVLRRRLEFLNGLEEAARPLADPAEILAAALRLLGERLGVDRVAYAEVDADGDGFLVPQDWVREGRCRSMAGRYRVSDFGPRASSDVWSGRTLVIRDMGAEVPADAGGGTFGSVAIAAIVCCPLLRGGRLSAMMAVHQAEPRDWTDEEIALVQAAVERCWAYVERARVRRELADSEERFRAVADNIPQLAWMADETGWTFWYNRRWFDYTGTTLGEMEGWGWTKIHDPAHVDRVVTGFGRAVAASEPWEDTFPLRGRDGRFRWFLSRAVPVRDAAGRVVRWFGTNTDVTAQRAAEETLRSAKDQAEAANRLKDEFLATVSHELRTPLNAIVGWVRLMRMGGVGPEDAEHALEVIDRNVRAQTTLINDLLDVGRITSGKMVLARRPVEVAAVVAGAMDSLRLAAEAKGVALETDIDPAAGQVTGDPDRLQQVIWNLLNNAVKFTPAGGRVRVRVSREVAGIRITVSDTGEGIPADFLPHVFERFRQVDQKTTRRHGGLGLGLAIVRHLVELHGGTARADSEGPGRGATFTVDLPVRAVRGASVAPGSRADAAVPGEGRDGSADGRDGYDGPDGRDQPDDGQSPHGEPRRPPGRLAGARVLVVDDEADARELVALVLRKAGASVETAGSADEALSALGRFRPEVLVSDIGMPGGDGYGLIRRVRSMPAAEGGAAAAVALTAYSGGDERRRVVEAGFQEHLSKPADPDALVAAVARLRAQALPSALPAPEPASGVNAAF